MRDVDAGERVAADIDGEVRVAPLELTVRAFVESWEVLSTC